MSILTYSTCFKGCVDCDKVQLSDKVRTMVACFAGWNPKTSLWDLLESTLTYQHRTYAEAIKQATAKPVASS